MSFVKAIVIKADFKPPALFAEVFIIMFLSRLFLFTILFMSALPLQGRAQSDYLPTPYTPWLAAQAMNNGVQSPRAANNDFTSQPPSNAPAQTIATPNGSALPQMPRDFAARQPQVTQPSYDDALIIEPQSTIEATYASRVIQPLQQFGYDLFSSPSHNTLETNLMLGTRGGLPAGATQDDFVLSSGDRLRVTFRGQRNESTVYDISSQGLIIIDDLPPLTAAGRSIAQLRTILEDMTDALINTDIYVSLDQVRQIDILVVGHINKPGRQTLTVFHSVMDALEMAGGIDKTGSLRQIKLVRNGRSTQIDLYGLLIHGSANMDLRLMDGDKIIVPPIGPTVAVGGNVKRPGIFEITPAMRGLLSQPHNTSQKISLEDMLQFAGGVLSPGKNRFMKLGLSQDGAENVAEINAAHDRIFSDGSILVVSPAIETRTGMIELAGHTTRPGMHALQSAKTLSAVLDQDNVLGSEIYPLIGIVERWSKEKMAPQMFAFSPLLVRKGETDRRLQDGDVVHLFSRPQILALADAQKDNIAYGSVNEAQENSLHDAAFRSFLNERTVSVRGAVRTQGAFPIVEGVTLANVIAVAGGLSLEADTSNIEITSRLLGEGHQSDGRSGTLRKQINFRDQSPEDIMIGAGDTVRINQKFEKIAGDSVHIIGEVRNPGIYDLMPGDKMSDLLTRAGGLTEHAYPNGTIFSRESERRAEEARFRSLARDMERSIAQAIQDSDDKNIDSDQIKSARALASELRDVEAVGRLTVEADPGILKSRPELDFLLAGGDRIYVPKRPMTVRLSGEILSPANLQFESEKDPIDYIREAGGFTYHADKERTFVLFPDGSAKPLQVSAWNHSYTFIPPGSTIIVPRDPKPFDFIQSARDVTQILSNLAITGIFLDDLQDDN